MSKKSKTNTPSPEFIFESNVPNDKIDIYGDIDVTVTKLPSESENELEFRAKLEGYNIDHSVANAIRRSVLLYIPVYGFHRSNIRIENEKSYHMYNNDMIFNQIEMLPIYDIPNYWDISDPEVFMSNEVMKKLFSKFIPDKYIEEEGAENKEAPDDDKKLFNIELTLSVTNTTTEDKFVSTHDAILKIDNKVSNSYLKKDPISILVLKPGENISLSATANLGISKIHAIYEATTNAVSIQNSLTSYEINYESLGQLDKNIIFIKACLILIKKLESLSKYLKKRYANTEEHLDTEMTEIELYGEDHTLGNLITTVLQKCEYTIKAGYVMPHPFIDSIISRYVVNKKSKKDPITLILDVIEYLMKLMTKIMDSMSSPKRAGML